MARPRKHNPPLPDSQRVADYRKRLKAEGYRNISFLVSPEEYELIEQTRARYQLSTKEMVMYFLKGQHLQEGKGLYEVCRPETVEAELNLRLPADQQSYLAQKTEQGELFQFPNQKEYLLVAFSIKRDRFPSLFPFEAELIKGFNSYQKPLRYFLKKAKVSKSKQLVLMQRVQARELGWEPPQNDWYAIRLKLNQIYPQIEETHWVEDPVDYPAELTRLAKEYEED